MTDTEEKLGEAKYFLDRMGELQNEREPFKYNLSAFLAAFRSITLLMQKEFDKIAGFKDWYEVEREKLKADYKVKKLKDARVDTIHKKTVRPKARIDVSMTARVTVIASGSAVVKRGNGAVERHNSRPKAASPISAENEPNVRWRWYFNEINDIDVVTFCQECVKELERMVSECVRLFGNAPRPKNKNTV